MGEEEVGEVEVGEVEVGEVVYEVVGEGEDRVRIWRRHSNAFKQRDWIELEMR